MKAKITRDSNKLLLQVELPITSTDDDYAEIIKIALKQGAGFEKDNRFNIIFLKCRTGIQLDNLEEEFKKILSEE